MATNKPAKMGHKTTQKQTQDDLAAARLVMLTGGHRVTDSAFLTVCGVRREKPWHYGVQEDVTCRGCMTEAQIDALAAQVEVPPGQFEMDKVLAELGVE